MKIKNMTDQEIHEEFIRIYGDDDNGGSWDEREMVKSWYRLQNTLEEQEAMHQKVDANIEEYSRIGELQNGRMISFDEP